MDCNYCESKVPQVNIDEHSAKARLWKYGASAGLLMALYAYLKATVKGAKANHHWDEAKRERASGERDKWLIIGAAAFTASVVGTTMRRLNEAKSLKNRLSARVKRFGSEN